MRTQPGRAHLGKRVISDGVGQDRPGPVIQQLEALGLSQSSPVGEEEPDGASGEVSALRPPESTTPISPQRVPGSRAGAVPGAVTMTWCAQEQEIL